MPKQEIQSLNITHLGQIFTPQNIVADMLGLIQNTSKVSNPRFLEPSCGNGAFFTHLPCNKIGIELDSTLLHSHKIENINEKPCYTCHFEQSEKSLSHKEISKDISLTKFAQYDKKGPINNEALLKANEQILNMDFFAYPVSEKFDIIIGNPPYVRYQDILQPTKALLSPYKSLFDGRSNLYLFFIYKCILHLNDGGELIFITPRDFLKSTSSVKLNEFIFSQGTITDFIDLGDKKIFDLAQPNCAIWRFEKGNFGRSTNCLKSFSCVKGQILFTNNEYCVPFSDLFFVKVGAVSGADSIFHSEKWGNVDFVNSTTAKSGKTRKMIYGEYAKTCPYLQKFKPKLLERKIKKFNEFNWWAWGRDYFKSDLPRLYVNSKTRNKKPFFLHECKAYDGSVLAIFPKFEADFQMLKEICEKLNSVNWHELGFICDGRFLFSQRSLENALLPCHFKNFYQNELKNVV